MLILNYYDFKVIQLFIFVTMEIVYTERFISQLGGGGHVVKKTAICTLTIFDSFEIAVLTAQYIRIF